MNNLGMLLWNQGQLDEAGPRSSDGSQGHFVGPGPEAWIFSRFPILLDYVHFFLANYNRTLLVTPIHETVNLIAEIDNLPSLSDLYDTLHTTIPPPDIKLIILNTRPPHGPPK